MSPVNAEYDFHWCVYQTNVQGYAPKLDTIATTRNWSPMTWILARTDCLLATERGTGITRIEDSR
ncbi:MAG: hypothetical protein ACLS35_02980 [Odoribacter splanchnicus]